MIGYDFSEGLITSSAGHNVVGADYHPLNIVLDEDDDNINGGKGADAFRLIQRGDLLLLKDVETTSKPRCST